jgi:hypothetical protein
MSAALIASLLDRIAVEMTGTAQPSFEGPALRFWTACNEILDLLLGQISGPHRVDGIV